MTRFTYLFLILILGSYLTGCAGLNSDYEPPTVNISSFNAIPGQGIAPRFKIGLHIVNPNRTPLDLKGISYTISLEGHKLLTGVSNKLPKIDAYGEGDIELEASVNIFNSIGFFTDLTKNQKRDSFEYRLDAKLDTGNLHPVIRVSKKGNLSLFDPSQQTQKHQTQ